MKIEAIKLKEFYKVSSCMYTNIMITAKRARQIIDSRYEKVMLEKNIEDTEQLESLVEEENFDMDKPISKAMNELLNGQIEWRKAETQDEDGE